MSNEPVDFDDMFPTFDPACFDTKYPSKDDYPVPYWGIAMRRVYDHELHRMASDPHYSPEVRAVACRALEAIARNYVDAFVCDLAGTTARSNPRTQAIEISLDPVMISVYLSVILWTVFREPGESEWLRHVLHMTIGAVDLEGPGLSVEQAFVAGWAAGLVDGIFGGDRRASGDAAPTA